MLFCDFNSANLGCKRRIHRIERLEKSINIGIRHVVVSGSAQALFAFAHIKQDAFNSKSVLAYCMRRKFESAFSAQSCCFCNLLAGGFFSPEHEVDAINKRVRKESE